jgi:tRNA (cmo5U34)-methyltransferase
MTPTQLQSLFDQQAPGYDERWAKTAPIRDGLHFLLQAVFAGLPANARLLCVGVGTGDELRVLAQRYPDWQFVAVEPSGTMLDICRSKARPTADSPGFADRCHFHHGFLDTLPAQHRGFDGATCFLVSQFILSRAERVAFFAGIAARLRPGGVLTSSDLSADTASAAYAAQLALWLDVMAVGGIPTAGLEQMRAAYAQDVAILPPAQVAAIIQQAGFDEPVPFYRAGLIHAWFARRGADGPGA